MGVWIYVFPNIVFYFLELDGQQTQLSFIMHIYHCIYLKIIWPFCLNLHLWLPKIKNIKQLLLVKCP